MSNYILFFGHTKAAAKKATGKSKYRYLSNFAKSIFSYEYNNKTYTFVSNEQYFMWRKALYFGDTAKAKEIYRVLRPNPTGLPDPDTKPWKDAMMKMKRLGRQVSNFDQEEWAKKSKKIMLSGLRLKFGQNDKLKRILLSTGDKILAESSPTDKIWGIGLGASNPKAQNKENWRGKNWLGECLMKVRDELMAESDSD